MPDREPIVTTGLTSPGDIAADETNKQINENRTATMKYIDDHNQGVAIFPGGQRRPAAPHVRAFYTVRREADILGNPEGMLSEDWRREHRGWHYQWPVRMDNLTASMIRSGYFVPVPYEAIDSANPHASVSDIKTPGGRWVIWKSHVLVAVSPQAHDELITQYEDLAIARTVNNPGMIADQLNARNPGFQAEVRTDNPVMQGAKRPRQDD